MKARENPFRVERQHALRFRFLAGNFDELLLRLNRLNYRGAIIGPHGSGKTTLLEELFIHLRDQGESLQRVRFTQATAKQQEEILQGCLQAVREKTLLIIDGAELLRSREWKSVLYHSRACRGLIITSHRSGLLPTVYECRTDAELLADLVKELLADKMILDPQLLPELFKRHAGNLRECLRELYDHMPEYSHSSVETED